MNPTGLNRRQGAISAMAVLLLFAMFALLSVGVLTAGMTVYQKTRTKADSVYHRRTSLSYIANQIRQADRLDGVEVVQFHGSDALSLRQTYWDTNYYTYIYVWDGQLRELFFEEGLELPPESGAIIVELTQMSVSVSEEGLIHLSLTYADGGYDGALSLSLRTGGGQS